MNNSIDFLFTNPYNNRNRIQKKYILDVMNKENVAKIIIQCFQYYLLLKKTPVESFSIFTFLPNLFEVGLFEKVDHMFSQKNSYISPIIIKQIKSFNYIQLANNLNNLQKNYTIFNNGKINRTYNTLGCVSYGYTFFRMNQYMSLKNKYNRYYGPTLYENSIDINNIFHNIYKTFLINMNKYKIQGNLIIQLNHNPMYSGMLFENLIIQTFKSVYNLVPIHTSNHYYNMDDFVNIYKKRIVINGKSIDISYINDLCRIFRIKSSNGVLYANLIIGMAIQSILKKNINSIDLKYTEQFKFPIFIKKNISWKKLQYCNTVYLKNILLDLDIPLTKNINNIHTVFRFKSKKSNRNFTKDQISMVESIDFSYNLLKNTIFQIIDNTDSKYFNKSKLFIKQLIKKYFDQIFIDRVIIIMLFIFGRDK